MTRPRRAAWGVQALLCIPLVACSAGSPSAGTLGAPADVDITAYSDVRAVLDPVSETITYPIDAFFIDRAGLGRIAQANAILLDVCMRDDGRRYPPAQFDLTTSTVSQDTYYGLWSEDRAARFGYGFDDTTSRETDAAAQAMIAADQADPGWSPAFEACLDSTERLPEIGRDVSVSEELASFGLPQSLRLDASALASSGDEWDRARRSWSDCLEARGLQLQRDVESPWAPEVPEDPEESIRVALLDVECKQETDLVETLSGLESQYQAALIDRHRAALDEVAEKERAIVARADEILAGHGG